MTHYYAEVKRGDMKHGNVEYAYYLVGLHETSNKSKPDPAYGGDACIPISELAYVCLSASHGSKARIQAMLENLEWLEGEEN